MLIFLTVVFVAKIFVAMSCLVNSAGRKVLVDELTAMKASRESCAQPTISFADQLAVFEEQTQQQLVKPIQMKVLDKRNSGEDQEENFLEKRALWAMARIHSHFNKPPLFNTGNEEPVPVPEKRALYTMARIHTKFNKPPNFNTGDGNFVPVPGKRIVGGRQIGRGQWPFLVSLRFKVLPGVASAKSGVEKPSHLPAEPIFEHLCGGTLIHPQFVLTALHCFEASEAFPFLTKDPADWAVKVGEHHLQRQDDDEEFIPVSEIIPRVSTERESQLTGDDILLIKLSRRVKIGRFVRPVCLPPQDLSELAAGMPCLTAGWGLEWETDLDHSLLPKHVELPIFNKTQCRAVYEAFEVNIAPDMICAGGHSEGGQDSCRYDSGGPLICRNSDDIWNYVGIVSFGAGCGQPGIPGIYTSVLSHLDWVEKMIAKELE